MKTISFELAKRLNEKWLLDNIETEYIFYWWNPDELNTTISWYKKQNIYEKCLWDIKTLTFDEAIEFLPKKISFEDYDLFLFLDFFEKKLFYWLYSDLDEYNISFKYKESLLEAIEEMLKFLLDNNLLTK